MSLNKMEDKMEDISPEVMDFFKNATIPEDGVLEVYLESMTVLMSLIFILSVFSNVMVMSTLNTKACRNMSFPVFNKISCIFNIFCILFSLLRYHTLLAGFKKDWSTEDSNFILACHTILWWSLVFDHSAAGSLAFMVYSRIKFVGQVDMFDRPEDAIRTPLMLNTLMWLLSMVPVSKHLEILTALTKKVNKTECLYTLTHQYSPVITEVTMSLTPLLEDVLILLLLMILVFRLLTKKYAQWRLDRQKRHATNDSETFTLASRFDTPSEHNADTKSSSSTVVSIHRFHPVSSVIRRKGISYLDVAQAWMFEDEEVNELVPGDEVLLRDWSHTKMTLVYGVAFLLLRVPRDIVVSADLGYAYASIRNDSAEDYFVTLVLTKTLFCAYFCLPYVLAWCSSHVFRKQAKNVVDQFSVSGMYEPSDAANSLRQRDSMSQNDMFTSIIHLDRQTKSFSLIKNAAKATERGNIIVEDFVKDKRLLSLNSVDIRRPMLSPRNDPVFPITFTGIRDALKRIRSSVTGI